MGFPFENEHFVVADKPAGWLSVPGRQGEADPRPVLGPKLEAELGLRLWPVHRLDAEVTGLILFAKTAEAHRTANGWFERREVEKEYEALTETTEPAAALTADEAHTAAAKDAPASPSSTREVVWRCKLLRGKKRAYEAPHGKPSETAARLLGEETLSDGPAFRWRLEPRTGRAHQLRYELFRHGYPILGDSLYGARRPYAAGGIALRCVRLGFARCPGASALGLPEVLQASPLSAQPVTAHEDPA